MIQTLSSVEICDFRNFIYSFSYIFCLCQGADSVLNGCQEASLGNTIVQFFLKVHLFENGVFIRHLNPLHRKNRHTWFDVSANGYFQQLAGNFWAKVKEMESNSEENDEDNDWKEMR